MEQKLKGMPETLLVPLWARATETKHDTPIVKDEKAVEIMDQIDYDFSKFKNQEPTQVSVAVRTEILDRAVKSFIDKYPAAAIINIGCGLDTRFLRVDNGKILWYDLDLPEVISIRKQFFHENERQRMIAKSVFDYSWIDDINTREHVLIIAEGILMYLTEQEVKNIMDKLSNAFKGAEMLLETTPASLVKQNQKQDLIKDQYQIEARLQWGIKRGKDIEKLNPQIKFIDDWHYFDYHKDRWRIIRWLSLIPTFKDRFGNRIVHLKFI
ncbi:MAG TPA: class I SAM-dependent methyltransferase [Methanobacterium sp.]|nr:class I SAM-dependent methyltransferase [Methanobacterium sp.]